MGTFRLRSNCVWILFCIIVIVGAFPKEETLTKFLKRLLNDASTSRESDTTTTTETTYFTTVNSETTTSIGTELPKKLFESSTSLGNDSTTISENPETGYSTTAQTSTIPTTTIPTTTIRTTTIPTTTIPTTTIPTPTGVIKNISVIYVGSTSFNLTWTVTTPEAYNYSVIIERIQPGSDGHYWRKSCDNGMNVSEYITNITTLSVDQISPDFNYTVNIALEVEEKWEGNATLNVTTLSTASDKPDNVTYKILNTTFTNNIMRDINLTWKMPCNTNGPVDRFFIEVVSFYIYDDDKVYSNLTYTELIGSKNGSGIFYYTIKDISAASNYSLSIYAGGNNASIHTNGTRNKVTFLTNDNYPSQPEAVQNETSLNNLTLFWKEPSNKPGRIISYKIEGNLTELNWIQISECNLNLDFETQEVHETNFNTTLISGASYDIDISAQTSVGWGNSTSIQLDASMSEPEAVKIVAAINESAILYFTPGCFFGAFQSYYIQYRETRNGQTACYDPVTITDYNMNSVMLANILPEMEYEVNVTVSNLEFNKTSTATFQTPSISPLFNMTNIEKSASPTKVTRNQVEFTLQKDIFTNDHNPLLYMAIIISNTKETGGEMSEWDKNIWPSVSPKTESDIYYQATDKFYNPFADEDTVQFVLGTDNNCNENQDNCNAPLQPGTTYYMFFRLFNSKYYKNTMPLSFVTEKVSRVSLILGVIFGLLFTVVLAAAAFVLWRKGIINKVLNKVHALPPVEKRDTSIPQLEFIRYCCYLEEHPDVLEEQWQKLQEISLENYSAHETTYAVLSNNKGKNRYTDILPFDATRVKLLNIDEDDEMCSDYINASYIKGFSNTIEYIATQGPLSHTVRDFWKMVIQENVSIIVMVTRFVENKIEKCYRYFPKNHEILSFGEDIEIRCTTELNINTHCVRTLEVRMGLKQQTVIHMQFVEWPDFGVPDGTENLINFCNQFRERWDAEGGRAIVHCSAGVGRTGTIIATDILIRAIKAGRNIDVFNTVLELRKQRKSMVQRKIQYHYIYQMIRCFLEEGFESSDSQEHFYENVQLANRGFTNLVEEDSL